MTRLALCLAALVACVLLRAAPAAAQGELRIYNWNDYIAKETLARFERESGINVTYDVYDANELLDAKLRAGRTGYDLVVPTASPFLASQLRARLYRPLDRARIANYGNLDPELMKQLERYDPGNAHAIPWLWGTTGIGYVPERIQRIMADAPVYSLRMIFDPEVIARFRGCGIVLLDSPTDVFPAALLHLGLDPDSKKPEDLEKATELLLKIRPNIRKFHSSDYINDLANGDVCLVFGYSGDIKQAARRARRGTRVEYAIPSEGAMTWIDAWAIPADAANVEAAHRFLDFVLQPEIAALNSNAVGYANPVPASRARIDEAVRADPTVYPPPEVARRLYTISPADLAYERLRTRAWTRVKTGR